MKKNSPFLIILITTCAILILAFTGWGNARANGEIQPAATATPGMQPIDDKIGVIIDLPAGSTQKDIGKEVYRLTCSACHAYDGSGLTDAWRATWNPADQNCWQSKCHGYNHPEDGFYLPDSPAIVGSFFPYLFPTAADLYAYINLTMPWHDPGVLPPDQVLAVTAHVLVLNGFDPGEDLNPDSAANFRLLPEGEILPTFTAVVTQPSAQVFIPLAETTAPSTKTVKKPAYLLYGIIGLTLISGIGWLIIRKTGK